MSEKEEKAMFKIGLVGAGIIGKSYSDIILKNTDCEIAAVCDTALERAEEIAAFHNAKSFSDYKEMVEQTQLDAVILNLPHFLHCEAAVYFLQRNINVLLEKPMAMNVEECDRIIEAEKASSAKLAVGHLQRYFPAYREVKKILESKIYGNLSMITEVRNVNYLPNRPKWFLDKNLSGGGIVMNFGAHTLDKIMYVTDDSVQQAYANLSNPISEDNIEINAQILMKLRSGVSVNVTFCGCPGVGSYETVFYFEKGVVRVGGGVMLSVSEDGEFLPAVNKGSEALALQMDDFIKFLKDEKSDIVTSEYAREVIRVLEEILKD